MSRILITISGNLRMYANIPTLKQNDNDKNQSHSKFDNVLKDMFHAAPRRPAPQ